MITKTSELAVQILMYVASRPNRETPVPPKQIADAAKALSEGATAAAEGNEEPPDVGRSLAQLFSA